MTTPADPTPAGAGERERLEIARVLARHGLSWLIEAVWVITGTRLAALPREPQRVEREGLVPTPKQEASFLLSEYRSALHVWRIGVTGQDGAGNLAAIEARIIDLLARALAAPTEATEPRETAVYDPHGIIAHAASRDSRAPWNRAGAAARPAQGEAKEPDFERDLLRDVLAAQEGEALVDAAHRVINELTHARLASDHAAGVERPWDYEVEQRVERIWDALEGEGAWGRLELRRSLDILRVATYLLDAKPSNQIAVPPDSAALARPHPEGETSEEGER